MLQATIFIILSLLLSTNVLAQDEQQELSQVIGTQPKLLDLDAIKKITEAIESNDVDYSEELKGIENSIRDLIAKEDKFELERKVVQEERVLIAQEEMALWAGPMFISAAVTAILTFIGILLILRTLFYTKKASDHTRDMLDDAKATAKAALEGVEVSRQALETDTRPMIKINLPKGILVKKVEEKKLTFSGNLSIYNLGKTPADFIAIDIFHQKMNNTLAYDKENKFIKEWVNSGEAPEGFRSIFPGETFDNQDVHLTIETDVSIENSDLWTIHSTIYIRARYQSQSGKRYIETSA